MKITIEHAGVTATVETDVFDIHEALDLAMRCLMAIGYQKESVEDAIREKNDELNRE